VFPIDFRRKVLLSCPLVVVVAVAGLVVATPSAWAERLLGLAQFAGGSGCIAQPEDDDAEAIGGCGRGKGLIDANDAAVAADGAGVYVAAAGSNAVASFARESATGRLRQVNCVSANATTGVDGTKGACADGNALAGAAAVAVSPDGRNVYAASYASGGIAIFVRNAETAGLRQIGCVRAVRTCTSARALAGAASVAVSPDGRNVYLASAEADAVVSFSRDAATGLLSPLGCISDDGTDRLCLTGNALKGAYSIVVAPDGKNVYVAAYNSNAVLTFDRDAANGRLTQRGCILAGAPPRGSCVAGHALESPVDLAMTQDGRTVFAAALDSNAVVVFARNRTTGALAEIGCVSQVDDSDDEDARDGCAHARPLDGANSVAVSPDGSARGVDDLRPRPDHGRPQPLGLRHPSRLLGRGNDSRVHARVGCRRPVVCRRQSGWEQRVHDRVRERRDHDVHPRRLRRSACGTDLEASVVGARRLPRHARRSVRRPRGPDPAAGASSAPAERRVSSRTWPLGDRSSPFGT
jgi:6-phosphogluconolactonase (cycloisomerase 2 family)